MSVKIIIFLCVLFFIIEKYLNLIEKLNILQLKYWTNKDGEVAIGEWNEIGESRNIIGIPFQKTVGATMKRIHIVEPKIYISINLYV